MSIKLITPELFADILALHASGVPISAVLLTNYPFLSSGQFFRYALRDSESMKSLTLARECFAHSCYDDTVRIADTVRDPAMARNMINARQQIAARFLPKQYSEKINIDVEHKVDIGSAIMMARERIAQRQLIDITNESDKLTIDSTSEASHDIDPFS